MSVTPSYPGLYIQELNASSHAITPAPTSIAAFVGYSHPFQTAAFNVAQQCFSFSDYETYFGPLFSSGLVDASLPRAVYQFFLNGGSTAWVTGLQPGMFAADGSIISRLGAQNGGTTITATTAGGPSAEAVFTIDSAATTPKITSISPTSTTAGGAAFQITINGTDFPPSPTVSFGGTVLAAAAIASATSTKIVANIKATAIAAAGSAAVTVNGSPAATFTINASNLVPTISSVSPASIPAGGPQLTVTINGSNFVPASTVQWNGAALPAGFSAAYVSDTQMTLTVPPGGIAVKGGSTIAVSNPGAASASNAAAFTVTDVTGTPALSSMSPGSVTAGSADFTLVIQGSGFAPGATVNFGGTVITPTVANASANQLTVTIPAALVAAGGPLAVTVSNPTGGTSGSLVFAVNGSNLTPVISSLSPGAVPAGGAAFDMTIYGANFVSSSTVQWNGAALPAGASASYVSDSQINVTGLPATLIAKAGIAYVTVSNPVGAGIVFTALELTDVVPMNVSITNVRGGGAIFDVIVTYGTRVEAYRGVQLNGSAAQLPDAMINKTSTLVRAAPTAAGYGASIAKQEIALTLDVPVTLATCFSAADFIVGDGSTISVFEANSSLDNVEIFNLLMTPGITDTEVVSAAMSFAERKRAFAIIDPPPQSPAFGSAVATPQPVADWMTGLGGPTGPSLPRSQNAALYFPYLTSPDPVTGNNIPVAPSGFVAGVYAATDASRGVWKAPAGLATTVLNTTGPVPSGIMNDPQQGVLNLDSINCLRTFSGIGTVVWGARTTVANNQAFAQSMYVPVRRMTLFIEQTLLANLKWVVFEPNDEPLWAAIRSSIEAFMLSLFRQGALQGSTPSQAFQVRCDSNTTTSTDQANGIVNIVVAFAPLKPAEFVIIQIAQLAGQTSS